LEYATSKLSVRLTYYILHFILICVIVPWLIGATYSLFLQNIDFMLIAGLNMIIFSLPVTIALAIGCSIFLRVFYDELNKSYFCLIGCITGVFFGFLLGFVFGDNFHFYVIATGILGVIVGYILNILYGHLLMKNNKYR
jgi:hypothetical protein